LKLSGLLCAQKTQIPVYIVPALGNTTGKHHRGRRELSQGLGETGLHVPELVGADGGDLVCVGEIAPDLLDDPGFGLGILRQVVCDRAEGDIRRLATGNDNGGKIAVDLVSGQIVFGFE
jgi:hypothetical protein